MAALVGTTLVATPRATALLLCNQTSIDSSPATNITSTGAQLNGTTIDNCNSRDFEYGPTGAFGFNTDPNVGGTGAYSHVVTGLSPGTTYFFRARAGIGNPDTEDNTTRTFTTLAAGSGGRTFAPTTAPATDVGPAAATLHGRLEVGNDNYHYEYGPTTALGTSTPSQRAPAYTDLPARITGLTPGRNYFFALISDSGRGAILGFTTTAARPPTTGTATDVTVTSALLRGTVSTAGEQYHFEYGTTTAYGTATPQANASAADSDLTATVTGLAPSTEYHFRIVSTIAGNGLDRTFTTPAPPAPPTTSTTAAPGTTTTTGTPTTSTTAAPGTTTTTGTPTTSARTTTTAAPPPAPTPSPATDSDRPRASRSRYELQDSAVIAPQDSATAASPLVAAVLRPGDSGGHWTAHADGAVFAFGGAPTFRRLRTKVSLVAPIVAIAATATGWGYLLTAPDGGVFVFGDAPFFGSMHGRLLNQQVVAIAATPSGDGYWLAGADGGVFSFGDARFFGSTARARLASKVVAIAATRSGRGYWLLTADGVVFAFGDAPLFQRTPLRPGVSAVALFPGRRDTGYTVIDSAGRAYPRGRP